MFHRSFQVVRHARRQAGRSRVGPQHPLVLRCKPRKSFARVGIQRRNTHQPDQLQRSAAATSSHSSSTNCGRRASTPPRVGSPSRLTCTYTRSRCARHPHRAPRRRRGRAQRPAAGCRPNERRRPTAPVTGPCFAGSVRPCASARIRLSVLPPPRIWRPLLVHGIRRKNGSRICDKIATSVAGKNFVMGSSSISPALRPAASAASSIRRRTAARATRNSSSRSVILWRSSRFCSSRKRSSLPLALRASAHLHPDDRCQPPGRGIPAMTEQVGSPTVHRGSISIAFTPKVAS